MVTFGRPERDEWERRKQNVQVAPTCIVAPEASLYYISPPAPLTLNLRLGADSHVYSQFNFVLPDARITVGERCQLGAVNFVCSTSIEVGDDVLMAWGINILDSDHHSLYWEERQHDVERCRRDYVESDGRAIGASHDWSVVARKPVRIGSKSWIGFNAIILKGVTLGEGVIIAPGSVVTHDIPAWTMAGGNPCKPIRRIEPTRPKDHANAAGGDRP